MTLPESQCEEKPPPAPAANAARLTAAHLVDSGIWRAEGEGAVHRIAHQPFVLTPDEVQFLHRLGEAIWSFYKALNHLYLRKGHEWADVYLDRGKPSWLIELSRMNYFKRHLPRLLRPDLILGDDRMWVTELDSVPGGAGMSAAMARVYADAGYYPIGGAEGIPKSFAATLADLAGCEPWSAAIMVSDESEDYRTEMQYLASELRRLGHGCWCIHPRDVIFDEEGLWLDSEQGRAKLDTVWRFFELFDLRNIPKQELVIYANKKRKTVVSPPYKPYLEEKLALALLHHHALADFWLSEMGDDFAVLTSVVPKSWILDARPVPDHAEVSGLRLRGKPVRDFRDLAGASQKERRMVIKPSGFSHLAWGSRGVVAGHDVSQDEWEAAINSALDEFEESPHILQEFEEGKRLEISYFDPSDSTEGTMSGRARISPYYYVYDEKPVLAGVLATVCRDDKKLIHGMKDAVMTVCSERGS